MTQQTATEKDMFLQSFERETAITLSSCARSRRTARSTDPTRSRAQRAELAWIFITETGHGR